VPERMEQVYNRSILKENLQMWGKLYISKPEQTVLGWLVDSWSENGAPYWRPKMHWFDKKENKLHNVKLRMDFGPGLMSLTGEDAEIEPERANFIRATVEQWETEWLQEQEKKL
jgi:hypothetical protein